MQKDQFFEKMEKQGLALSYGDVRLKTNHSSILPADANLSSFFSRRVPLKCPIISSPMDTITEHKMAIEMAKMGGLGIIHRGLGPKEQALEVARVKFYLNGFIKKPICVFDDQTIEEILKMINEKDFSFRSFPVIDRNGKLVGLLTNNDFDFCPNYNLKAREIMSRELITAKEGTNLEEAYIIMRESKKKILPVINNQGNLEGMYVYSDVKRIITGGSPLYNLDCNGNLRVGAAVGTGDDAFERLEILSELGVDVVVIDTAHADTKSVLQTLKEIKTKYNQIDVVVGNISEGESAKRLADAGADGVKVGQGPGSICTTRIVAGIGCPQVTAIYNCARALRGSGVPVCADGGIQQTGDITIALATGANSVMLGNLLSGTKETPGEVIIRQGMSVKEYRGMGSLAAMQASKASRERYGQGKSEKDKLVPEGVEGMVPYKGEVAQIIFQCLGGLRSGMGYVGAATVEELQEKADFYQISGAGLGESHPHSLLAAKEAPNYWQL
jgi:IMP dehydrogenase